MSKRMLKKRMLLKWQPKPNKSRITSTDLLLNEIKEFLENEKAENCYDWWRKQLYSRID
jgi:hypothetical protein